MIDAEMNEHASAKKTRICVYIIGVLRVERRSFMGIFARRNRLIDYRLQLFYHFLLNFSDQNKGGEAKELPVNQCRVCLAMTRSGREIRLFWYVHTLSPILDI